MKKRTKLSERKLPDYYKGEEIMNMITHIVGGSLGIAVLVLCIVRAAIRGNVTGIIGSAIYGSSMISLYTISSVYHGLRSGTGKKVMQIIDHCTIYFLIIGTYTAILMAAIIPAYPGIGWSLLAAEWAIGALATTLTAIDLHNYRVLSMVCYIVMGWGILVFTPQTIAVLTMPGFLWLLAGGIAYTVGAICYGIGSKKHWIHSVFHIFVVIGSVLQFICVFFYAL